LSWAAAVEGRLDVLEWATTEGYTWDHGLVWAGAAAAGNLHVLEWSLSGRPGDHCRWSMPPRDSRPGHAAARNGHMEVLQWLHARGCPLDAITCASAARGGTWRCSSGRASKRGAGGMIAPAPKRRAAATSRSFSGRAPMAARGARTCVVAAAYGHLDILQWARANDCPWDERTCLVAAAYGHLPALRWARQSGCPLDAWTCATMYNAAVAWGFTDVAAWLEANEAGSHLLPLWDDEYMPVVSRVDIAKMVRRAEEEWIFFY
jgi:hypothetical protein